LKQLFLRTTKFEWAQIIWEAVPPNAPVATGLYLYIDVR